MYNNSSLSLSQDHFRNEINQYVSNVNYILSFVQAFICIMGILGNLLALIVINRKSLRNTSSAVFITYMSVFDTAVLLSHAANIAKLPRNLYLQCSLTYLTDLSIFCANWVLVIITLGNNSINTKQKKKRLKFSFSLERCVAVYSPFLAKRLCTIHSARHSMYILLTISIILFSGTFPFFYQIDNPSKNQKCLIRVKFRSILRIYQLILFYAIPDLFLLSNLFTVYALCRRQEQLSSMHLNNGEKFEIRVNDLNSNRKQRQLTIMLVTVSLSFYLFTTPAMIMFITESQPTKHRDIEKIKQTFLFSQIMVIFFQLNNAVS